MNADNMPIVNQNYLNQEDCSKRKNKGNLYLQNGSHGIGHNSNGVIKDNAKVAGKFEENNKNQSQKINARQVTVNNNLSNNSDLKTIKITKIKTEKIGDRETSETVSIEVPVSLFTIDLKEFLQNIAGSSIEIKDAERGSIRFIIKGSEQGLKNITKSFESGELAPVLKQQFNLELENAQLIESDSCENYQINQNQKLLAFTLAGNVSQDDIDILKASLIGTSDDDEEVEKNRNQADKVVDLKRAELKRAEPRRAEPRRAEPRRAEPRRAEPRRAELLTATATSVDVARNYTIEAIREEAISLAQMGIITINQPIRVLFQYLPSRKWNQIECELERNDYLLRDRIVDLIGSEEWDLAGR